MYLKNFSLVKLILSKLVKHVLLIMTIVMENFEMTKEDREGNKGIMIVKEHTVQ